MIKILYKKSKGFLLFKFSIVFLISLTSIVFGYKSRGRISNALYHPKISLIGVSTKDYKQFDCPKNAFIISTFGQSNSANTVSELSSKLIPKNLYQYDWKSRSCYEYKEPLLGATGNSGNIITYTAVQIAEKISSPVIVVPFGVGGSSILRWAYGDLANFKNQIVLTNLKKDGLYPDVFYWHQGESDSSEKIINESIYSSKYLKHPKTGRLTKKQYANALVKVVDSTLSHFPKATFGIAIASICENSSSPRVTAAQFSVASTLKKTFISSNTDRFKEKYHRPDGCHFSPYTAQTIGEEYLRSYQKSITILDK